MQQIHVLTNFKIFIPVTGEDDNHFNFDQITNPTLGLTLSKDNTNETWQYQVELINCEGAKEVKINRGLIWAKRVPYKLQTKPNSKIIEGLLIQLKVNAGLFDFRSIKERLIRFEVKCFSGGRLVSDGTTSLVQLLAKKRYASEKESEAEDVPIIVAAWTSTQEVALRTSKSNVQQQYGDYYTQRSFVTLDPPVLESPPHENYSTVNETSPLSAEAIDSDESMIVPMSNYDLNFLGSNSDSVAEFEAQTNYDDNEQYMVLYNGNAEVIGNFRALNFYKASDINLKEDIRYISSNVDPRQVLLRIDGVEYKFKEGVRGNTNSQKRFVGYIAQQIESVVPEAVQLINGILHVDYESLLPFLSESIKQNFHDINALKSNMDQVTLLMDTLYKEFIAKDLQRQRQQQYNSGPIKEIKKPLAKRKKFRWLMIGGAAAILLISAAIGAYFIWASLQVINGPNSPSTPITTPSPILTPTPIVTPTPVPVEAPIPIQIPVEAPIPIQIPIPIAAPLPNSGPPIDVYARERSALQDFYEATGGPGWLISANWATNSSVCSWSGVKCDLNDRVTGLLFTEPNNMTGTLPETLKDLDMLAELTLAKSGIGGTIPNIFGGLTQLKNLILTDDNFNGQFPLDIFNLKQLEIVSIIGNSFDPWTLPTWINNASSLVNLILVRCNLVGAVPANLGKMPSLRGISIINNTLSGSLPSFKSATLLGTILFYNTSLIGDIPEIPSSLVTLRLPFNRLTGGLANLPSTWEPTWLDLQNNDFTGKFKLSAHSMMAMSTLNIAFNGFTSVSDYTEPVFLTTCFVSNNKFGCPLPTWIWQCSGAICT